MLPVSAKSYEVSKPISVHSNDPQNPLGSRGEAEALRQKVAPLESSDYEVLKQEPGTDALALATVLCLQCHVAAPCLLPGGPRPTRLLPP